MMINITIYFWYMWNNYLFQVKWHSEKHYILEKLNTAFLDGVYTEV